jgi:hypothetical protein
MRKSLWCAALIGLGASTASAQLDANLEGSDTLFNIMNRAGTGVMRQLETSGAFAVGDMDYIGLGSSNGQAELQSNFQEIAPMSRFLNASGCNDPLAVDPGCWAVGLDGLAIAADNTEHTTCEVLRYSGTLNVVDQNGDGLVCPSCTGNVYTFTDWRDALRIIYGGQHAHITSGVCGSALPARSPIAEKNCNSDVRRQLVASWSTMFEGGCTDTECTQGLKHAWRRDDASGTTDSFLEILSLPAIASVPFCNGTDSGTIGGSTAGSVSNFANADADPIRRTCENAEQICTGTGANANTNGLVLPVRSQVGDEPYFGITESCANPISVGAFGDVQNTDFPAPTVCLNGGAVIGGTCKLPKREGTGTAPVGFNCMANANNDPPGTTSPATFDARIYNSRPRLPNGLPIAQANNPAVTPARQSPWYRMHQTRVLTGANVPNCRELDASDQIGCFVNASPCSIGFAGVGAVGDASTPDTYPNRKGLGLVSDNNSTVNYPTAAGIQDACSTRYAFTRNLWMCTIDDFANTGSQASVGGGTFLAAQNELRDFITTNKAGMDIAVAGAGFITLPGASLTFTECQ